ncbi:MAG TPA: hypothetical protein VL371_17655 [Gemmataceae bacterium]|nr:hypothetical protein [Gemmataceae bacterium]
MFAVIREKMSSRTRHSSPQRARRLGIEALEERSLMTTAPLVFSTIQEGIGDFGNTTTTARTGSVAPMMATQIQGKLSSGADVDMFRVSLKQGQIFTADADSPALFAPARFGTPVPAPRLSLLNSSGVAVATNVAEAGQSLEYRAAQSGTYYVKVTDSLPSSTSAVSYSLDLRPIGLNNAIDANYLGKTGGAMSAFLDGTSNADGTKVLDIAGPVGHGFGIRGNWSETVAYTNGLPGATYKANGTVYLQTPNGEVPMALPAGGITLITKPQQWGADFGEVGSIDWNAPANLATYEAILAAVYPMGLLDLAAIKEGTKIGIGLGSDTVVQNTGAPVNPAVPYLYLTANPLMNSSIGSGTQLFSVVADPADPFLYIGSPMTSGYFPITGLAASQQGLIPFTPVTAPSQFSGTLGGHLFVNATIDTTALTQVPSEIDGNLVLNVDPNHTGKLFGGAAFTTTDLVTALTINPLAAFVSNPDAAYTLVTNIAVGINGELNISPFDKVSDAIPDRIKSINPDQNSLVAFVFGQSVPRALTVGQASLIYDGPTQSAYFRGGTNNPFDGTPLAALSPTSVDIDGAIKPGGAFYVDVQGGYKPFGLNATGEVEIKNNWPTEVRMPIGGTLKPMVTYVSSITADATVSALGVNAELHGSVQKNGDFVLNGSVDTISFGGLGGSASFTMINSQRTGFSFTSHLDATFLVSAVVRANIDVDFTFGVNTNGQVTYSGYGSASVDVWAPNDGWQVWDWHWESIGSVGVGVSNSKIWFTANGTRYDIYLP